MSPNRALGGTLVDGRRSEPGKPLVLAGWGVEAVLVLRLTSRFVSKGAAARQGTSEVGCQPRARLKTPRRGRTAGRGALCLSRPKGRQQKTPVSNTIEVGARRQTRGHSGLDRRKRRSGAAMTPEAPKAYEGTLSARRKPRVLRIGRSTGARVVSRLQKSAGSIFTAHSRGAERQAENAWDSAT